MFLEGLFPFLAQMLGLMSVVDRWNDPLKGRGFRFRRLRCTLLRFNAFVLSIGWEKTSLIKLSLSLSPRAWSSLSSGAFSASRVSSGGTSSTSWTFFSSWVRSSIRKESRKISRGRFQNGENLSLNRGIKNTSRAVCVLAKSGSNERLENCWK